MANEITNEGAQFKMGKVFNAVRDLMKNLKVAKNGKAVDPATGEILYTYIRINDLRDAVREILLRNDCAIRKSGAVRVYHDRKQNDFGVSEDVEVVENRYVLQSMEDGSYITGSGRGEGPSSLLADTNAFKNFIGTLCLLNGDEEEEGQVENLAPTEPVTKPEQEIKNPVTEAEKPAETSKKTTRRRRKKEAIQESFDFTDAPETPFSEMFADKHYVDAPVEPVETIAEPKAVEPVQEKTAKPETVAKPEQAEPEQGEVAEAEPLVTQVDVTDTNGLDAFADVVCPIRSEKILGKPFKDVYQMAKDPADTDNVAKRCILYVADRYDYYKKKIPEFADACVWAKGELSADDKKTA